MTLRYQSLSLGVVSPTASSDVTRFAAWSDDFQLPSAMTSSARAATSDSDDSDDDMAPSKKKQKVVKSRAEEEKDVYQVSVAHWLHIKGSCQSRKCICHMSTKDALFMK